MNGRLTTWLQSNRSNTRLGYLLQLVSRVFTAGMSLLWAPLLLDAMGKRLMGTFLSFQAVPALGGLGDLGLGGAVGLRVGQHLGQRDEPGLREFLASARTAFLGLAFVLFSLFLALAPWLPHWLGFKAFAGTGSLAGLFALCAPAVGLLILSSYVNNLNNAGLNLVWPVLPPVVFTQLALLAHYWLARTACPLWVQYVPYVLNSAVSLGVAWMLLRRGCPALAQVWPLAVNGKLWRSLLERSGWMYLYSLGAFVYMTTDRLLINAGFGPDQVPAYRFNYQVCELALFLIITASVAGLPKITQWLASPEASARDRGITEAMRLNQFQCFAGCVAALAYLAGNNLFIRLWLGEEMQVPLLWQAAFALNLAVTAGSQTALDLAARVTERGLRVGGMTIALTALLNLSLSFAAMKAGSVAGIAFATVLSQCVMGTVLSRYSTTKLGLAWWPWWLRSVVMPLALIGLAAAGRMFLPLDRVTGVVLLAGGYGLLAAVAAVWLGVTPTRVREELALLAGIFRK